MGMYRYKHGDRVRMDYDTKLTGTIEERLPSQQVHEQYASNIPFYAVKWDSSGKTSYQSEDALVRL